MYKFHILQVDIKNVKFFRSRNVLISAYLTLSQTSAYTARPWMETMELLHCIVCLLTLSFHWFALHLPMEGWLG